ncbi:MAG: SPASM domain-containing protein [Saprospiraceae bacterium]
MIFKELKLILQKTNFRRSLNIVKLLSSYLISKSIKIPIHWGSPMSISIEPTTACNLHCPECPSGLRSFSRPIGNLKFEEFQAFLNPLVTNLSSILFYFQGEPFINHELFKMIHFASIRGVYTMSSTNGHFLTVEKSNKTIDSGLDRLVISVDGTTQETYEKYRIGGELDKVIQGIKNLVEAKKNRKSIKPLIILQFLVVRQNEHQIEEMKLIAKELEVDHLELKSAQIYNYKNGSEFIPEQEIYSRYQKNFDGTYHIKNKLLNHCWRMWQGCVITWDGRVVPCCFDKDASINLGMLGKENFKNIWKGKAYKDFRTQIIKSRKNIEICKNCTEGTLV